MPFRRRPLRPRIPRAGRGLQRPPVPPMIRRALARAHQALESGRPLEAARIYVRLADQAYARNRTRPGVQMDLEATRAYLVAGDVDQAQTRALNALEHVLVVGRLPVQVRTVVERIEAAMVARGAEDKARAFRQRVDALLEAHGHSWEELVSGPSGEAATHRGRLPAQCPSCYAPLRSDEVTWLEADRAQCTYCGSIVLTE